jgi:hypothetical protein
MLMCCGSRPTIIATSARRYNFGAALPGIPAFRLPNPEPALPAALSLEIQIFSPYHDVVRTCPWPSIFFPNFYQKSFCHSDKPMGLLEVSQQLISLYMR